VRLLHGLLAATPAVPPVSETTAEPSEHGARILRVEADVPIPQLSAGATLFIRSFYDDCIEGVMANFEPTDKDKVRCHRYVITGNPGGESSRPKMAPRLRAAIPAPAWLCVSEGCIEESPSPLSHRAVVLQRARLVSA